MPKKFIKPISLLLCFCFFFTQTGLAQLLPTQQGLSPQGTVPAEFQLPILRYLSVNTANPSNYFNFLLDRGQRTEDGGQRTELNQEAKKLIHYFFLGLTLPSEAFWVNLKPQEPERITSEELSKTDLGRTLLEQDLKLKKDMANYLHPKHPQGKLYWERLYQALEHEGRKASATNRGGPAKNNGWKKVTITSSSRVWIVPAEAVVLETEDGALVAKAQLKVLLESEYLSLKEKRWNKEVEAKSEVRDEIKHISESLMKEIILPALTKEINESPGYAPLRQVYHSLILAEWFKRKNLKTEELKNEKTNPYTSYINSGTTKGLESELPWEKQAIWQEYLKSYQEGEYKLQDTIFGLKRMYFSGGMALTKIGSAEVMKVIPFSSGSPILNNPEIRNNNGLLDGLVVVNPAGTTISINEIPIGKPKIIFPESFIKENQEALSPVSPLPALPGNQSQLGASLLSTATAASPVIGAGNFKRAVAAIALSILLVSRLAGDQYRDKSIFPSTSNADVVSMVRQGERQKIRDLQRQARSDVKAIDKIVEIIKNPNYSDEIKRDLIRDLGVILKGEPQLVWEEGHGPPVDYVDITPLFAVRKTALEALLSFQISSQSVQLNKIAALTISICYVEPEVLRLRNAHLDQRVSDRELGYRLTEKSLNDNPFLLYTFYLSRENFGDLAKMIMNRLESQAKDKGQDLVSFLKNIDPTGFFWRDFLLQTANFSQLNRLLSSSQSIQPVLGTLFEDVSLEDLSNYALRLALFAETTLTDNTFPYQKDFQLYLRSLYDRAPSVQYRHFLAALFFVYQEKLNYIAKGDINAIAQKENIQGQFKTVVPYENMLKNGKLIVHIVFADKAAVQGHMVRTQEFFEQHGFKKIASSDKNQAIFEKGVIRLVLFKADEQGYNINQYIDEASMIISRSHAGKEEKVFKNQDAVLLTKGKLFFPSACRSATVIGTLAKYYQGAQFIGVNETAYGDHTNELTEAYLVAFLKRIPTYEAIHDTIRKNSFKSFNNFVLPGDRAMKVHRIMQQSAEKDHSVSSPLSEKIRNSFQPKEETISESIGTVGQAGSTTLQKEPEQGGIDLSQIELTLKDDKYISSLNPADIKILRAAKALKEEWNSLSLLYIHELMLLLLDDLASDIQNKNLLSQVLQQLQSQKFLDPQAIQFLNLIQANKPLQEIRLMP